MLKKKSNGKNSAADDLISSLLEDVNDFDLGSEENSELEATVYESAVEIPNEKTPRRPVDARDGTHDYMMSEFAHGDEDGDAPSGDDFWEQAEKMAGKVASYDDLNESDAFKNLDKKQKIVYNGPEASSDFLDQINAHLSPMHKSGVVNTHSDHGVHKAETYGNKSTVTYEANLPAVKTGSVAQGLNQATELVKELKVDKQELNDRTLPMSSNRPEANISQLLSEAAAAAMQIGSGNDVDRTVAVPHYAQRQNKMKTQAESENQTKPMVSRGESESYSDERILLVTQKPSKVSTSQVSIDASLAQAENLRMAQNRILELEKEIERLRQENDEILTASDILRNKAEEYTYRISELERESIESKTDFKNELAVSKGNLTYKENENQKLKMKVEELEIRIKTDFKKIRIRERELENRLELIKAEKQAVVKSKDELLLELQRKNDQAKAEIDNYREKVLELNKSLENTQSQIKMTVRALRIALSHIEDKSELFTPIKKAN